MVSTDDDEVNVDVRFLNIALFLYIDTMYKNKERETPRSLSLSLSIRYLHHLIIISDDDEMNVDVRFLALFLYIDTMYKNRRTQRLHSPHHHQWTPMFKIWWYPLMMMR